MSLFGSLGAAQSTTSAGGLFGSLGTATTSAQTTSTSLFAPASQASQTQSKPALFPLGGIGASATTAQPQAAASSLFGGLGAAATTSQAQASGGTLGGTFGSALKPALGGGSSLFGGASTTQQTAGGSLFGGLGASTATQPTTQLGGGASLLGSMHLGQKSQSQAVATQQQAQSDAAGQARGSSQAAYFEQLLERGKKRNNQENRPADLPSLQLGLGDIARKVRNLGSGGPSAAASNKTSDTRAHYLLAASGVSTASALRDLNTFSASAAASGSVIPAVGADIDAFVSNLHAQSTLELIQEGLEQSKRDFNTFLEEHVQMDWDTQRRRIYEHFGLAKPSQHSADQADNAFAESTQGAFGRSSRRNRGGHGASLGASASMSFGPAGMSKSVLGNSTMRNTIRGSGFGDADRSAAGAAHSGAEQKFEKDKAEKYATKVKALNAERNQENCYPVLHNFQQVEQEAGIDNTEALVNSFEALINITGENSSSMRKSQRGAIQERQYRAAYLNDNSNSEASVDMRKRIIRGSRTCLEKLFLKKMNVMVDKNPKIANLGGIPLPINRVRGYIRILASRKELATDPERLLRVEVDANPEKDYIWALIYYLLRCGLVKEAAQYVNDNSKIIRNVDIRFKAYLDHYAANLDRPLPPDLRQAMNVKYHQQMKLVPAEKMDPFCLACYKIIGRCELARRTLDLKANDEQDWLWLQFALAREVNRVEESAGEVFGLEQLQETVREIGQKYFTSSPDFSSNFGTFFFMQVLAGMFEQAVAWLAKDSHSPVSAVHFAIALAYYGLLRVSDLTVSELLSFTTAQKSRLQFALMVGYYTGNFRISQPEVATDYLVLLCLNADLGDEAGRRQAEICYEALRELVLETREFAQLLGDIRYDGQRVPGAIQQRLRLIRAPGNDEADTNTTFLKNLTIQAASSADDNGRTTDAVLLYHLADEYDTVISVCNRALSEVLSVELGYENVRLEPLKPRAAEDGQQVNSTLSLTSVDDAFVLTKNMFDLYTSRGDAAVTQISSVNRTSCTILLRMAGAKREVESSNWHAALDIIRSLNLLPMDANGTMSVIRKYAQGFASAPSLVARNIGDVLLWTISCISHLRDSLQQSEWDDPTRKLQAERLLQCARDLMIFAGLVRYKLPQRVFEALAAAGQDAVA